MQASTYSVTRKPHTKQEKKSSSTQFGTVTCYRAHTPVQLILCVGMCIRSYHAPHVMRGRQTLPKKKKKKSAQCGFELLPSALRARLLPTGKVLIGVDWSCLHY